MTLVQRAGQGLWAGRIVGRFSEVVIPGRHDCYLSLQNDLLAERIKAGVSTTNLKGALSILPTAKLSLRESFCPPSLVEQLELDWFYTPVLYLDNLTIILIFRYPPRLSSFQTLPERALFGQGSLLRCRVSSK